MHKLLKVGLCCCMTLLLGACAIRSHPPRVGIEDVSDWHSSADLAVAETDRRLGTVETAVRFICTDKTTLWVYLFARYYGIEQEKLPASYSAEHAYIEKENGERVIANPTTYKHISSVDGVFVDQCTASEPWPGEAGEVSLIQAMIRFDTASPVSGSRWTLHLGQLRIGNINISIPEKTVILRPREYYLQGPGL